MIKHHRAFTSDWFKTNHNRLCWAFNAPLLGRWLRRGLGLRRDGKVTDIRPESVVIEFEPGRYEYNGWTGDVVAQYVYEVAKPLWWAIHYWDEWVADRWMPELSYGFDTLTTYTQTASASTRAFDAFIQATASSFNAARSTTGTAVFSVYENTDPPTDCLAECSRDTSAPAALQNYIARIFFHFDTSPLAGTNRQNIPGTVTVDSAYVVCVEGANAITSPSGLSMGLYLTQSTISPSRTSTTIVGSDFRQTPLTTFAIGETKLQLPVQYSVNSLRLVPGTTTNPRFYWWIFDSFGLPEIESYYYPADPPGSVGAHNGLARFCLKQTIDFNNNPPSGNYAGVETIISRDRASSIYGSTSNGIVRNVLHAPRLNVVYTVGKIVDATSLVNQTQFGLPTIQAPREVRVNGFREYATEQARFGLPTIPPRELTVEVRSLVNPTVQFGNVLIPVIFARSLVNTSAIGVPSVSVPIRPTGIVSTATIFSPSISRDNARIVFPRGIDNSLIPQGSTLSVRDVFGLPFIEGAGLQIRPVGIASTVQFGARWYIGQAFPESVYINRLIDQPIQFQQVMHEYEDGRVDVNLQVCGVRSWRIEYEGISEAEVDILVQHFRDVKGRVGRFPFYHRRDDVVYEDCYYTAFDIPARVKKWSNNVSITIERQE